MYGVNAPQGFIPVRHESGSAWNGQLNSDYRIANGYNYNIGVGELVYISDGTATGGAAVAAGAVLQGSVVSWAQLSGDDSTVAQQIATVGVFMGCNYPQTNSFPITGPLGHSAWVAGTLTADGSDAVAYIITDPTVVYTAQCNGTGGFTRATATALFYGTFYNAGSTIFGDPSTPPGGTLNGANSTIFQRTCCQGIDLNTGAVTPANDGALLPIRTICLDPSPNNPLASYNNAYCMIQAGGIFPGPAQGQHP